MSKNNAALSIPASLVFYLGAPAINYIAYTISPKVALLVPLTFLPTAIFYKKWRDANTIDSSRRAELEPLLWTFVAGFALCTVVAPLQIIIAALVANMFSLVDDSQNRLLEDASSWRTWAFIATFDFGIAVMEEGLKYLPILYAKRRHRQQQSNSARNEESDEQQRRMQRPSRDRAYIDYVLAGALASGVFEAVEFLLSKAHDSTGTIVRSFVERMLACAGHVFWILPTALRAIRRDFPPSPSSSGGATEEAKREPSSRMGWWSVIGPGILLDFVNNSTSFGAMTLVSSGWFSLTTMWIMGLPLVICLYAIALWLVRQECRILNDGEKKAE